MNFESISWNIIANSLAVILNIAGLLSILLAILSFRRSRQMAEKMNNILEKNEQQSQILEDFAEAASTQYLGSFPTYMKSVVDLVNRSESNLRIYCIITTTGCYSEPDSSLELRHAIERTASAAHEKQDCNVEFVYGDRPNRDRFHDYQFVRANEDFEGWSRDEQNKRDLKLLAENETEDVPASPDALRALFESCHRKTVKNHFHRVKQYESDGEFSIWFWIADESNAIFVIPLPSDRLVAHGFKTSDNSLIKALMALFDQQKERSKKLHVE